MTAHEDEATAALRASLTHASSSWGKFDLTSRRPNLDKAATAAKDARDQSKATRHALANVTKSFKKSVKSTEAAAAALSGGAGPSSPEATALVGSVSDLAKSCRTTVKSYQDEIDCLTRRCKSSDSAFLDLHKALANPDLPDPTPPLMAGLDNLDAKVGQVNHLLMGMEEMNGEMADVKDDNTKLGREVESLKKQLAAAEAKAASAAESAAKNAAAAAAADKAPPSSGSGLNSEARDELIQLRREVAEYEVEFRSLKNQDITIRKLEAKIGELEEANETELTEQLEKAKQELAETEGRRAAEALEREATAERKLQSVELELRAERAGREATQTHLLEADEGASAREAAWEAQRQILVDDGERLRELLHEATRERDGLRLKVEALVPPEGDEELGAVMAHSRVSLPGQPPLSGGAIGMSELIAERKAFEAEVSEVTLMATALRDELKVKDETMTEERSTLQAAIDSLKADRDDLTATVTEVQAQMDKAPSEEMVENMKRELRILKRLEYNAEDADADPDRDPEMTPGGEGSEAKTLEAVLVGKLKRVEAELVKERRERTERSTECDMMRQQLSATEKARADADALVAALEADLEKAIQAQPTDLASTPSKPALPLRAKPHPATLQHVLDGSEPPPTPVVEAETPQGSAAAEKANDDHSVATIVMAQRDRLRARCDALEAERDSFKRELQVQVSSAESLKSDNTKLYEKVRYLQNFAGKGNAAAGLRNRQGIDDRDLDLEALEQRYEASVDPFRQFGNSERQRKLNEMSPAERFVYIVAKIVLGTKEMRTFLFFYMLCMHLLVFVTTYHWSHEMGCHDLVHHEDLAHFHGGVPFENAEQGAAAVDAAVDAAVESAVGGK